MIICESCKIIKILDKYEISSPKELEKILAEHTINCIFCSFYTQTATSKNCNAREDIGIFGTCIDDYDLHKLAKECEYYDG